MSYTHEMIKFNDILPAKIFIHRINEVQSHWHESIEILFVTKGKIELLVEGNLCQLKEDDLIIINSKEIHSVKSSEENIVIALQVDLNKFVHLYPTIEGICFKCSSFEHKEDDNRFGLIRKILAEMIYNDMKENNGHYIKTNALLHELLYIIINRFKESVETRYERKSYKHLERLNRVTSYLKENYKSDITLSQIAGMEHLCPQYFSKFFEKYMGVNFLTYLNAVRLEHAVKDLVKTDYNITDIAMNNGFANVKSFTHSFKNTYQQTPSSYRKKLGDMSQSKMNMKNEGINYFELNTNKHMNSIFKYLEEKPENSSQVEIINKVENTIQIDVNKQSQKINHTWKNLITIGKAKEGLIREVQEHLRLIQQQIGFKYIRFHGIFDDEMMVYDEDEKGNPIFDFVYVDKLFDFLLSIGIKPFIELGFMPSKLALSKEKIVFYTKSIISKPKDINLWNELVEKFVKHCMNRYGMSEVKSWYFEVWNEPDVNKIFGFDHKDYYQEFFRHTYETIKNIHEHLKVGGPAVLGHTILKTKWMDMYIKECMKNKCIPDFWTFHSYPIEVREIDDLLNMTITQSLEIKICTDKNEDYLQNLMSKLKIILKEHKLDKAEIYMTEWNATASHRELINDTLYKASYIVKNVLENIDSIEGFGYWIATDLLEESRVERDTFHGGMGLITHNGIKKSAFYAYELLSKLGGELIQKGEGYFVTKQDDSYQMILYNYCHIDKIYGAGDISRIDRYSRYNVFNNRNKCINLNLEKINSGDYVVKEWTLSRNNGSAFDTWLAMGQPEELDLEDIRYIQNQSAPQMKKYNHYIKNKYTLVATLEPHEVKMYTIKPIY